MKITEIIKYEGDNSTFVWKHPSEDFNATSQLIVHQSQEAIFFMNGEALDLFGPGRYTLKTQNIPLLRKLINLPTGGETPFHAEVYFINKTEQMGIKWGTDSKVQFMEPKYKFPIYLGASGEMSLRVSDSRKLLVKIVGTENSLSQEKLTVFFRAFLMTRVKSYLAQTIKEKQMNIFEMDEQLNELSEDLKIKLSGDFIDYGISLETFFVTNLVKPDGEPNYERFKNLHFRKFADITDAEIRQQVDIIGQSTQAKRMVIEAQGLAQKRSIEGYTYQQERGFDVSEKLAQNEGAGSLSSAGIGLGIMSGIGGTVGSTVGGIFKGVMSPFSETKGEGNNIQPAQAVQKAEEQPKPDEKKDPSSKENKFCEECGSKITEGASFCEECGAPLAKKPSCKKCGYVFERAGKFCPKCGTKREAQA